jgi:microcystin-dependent protein
MYESLIGTIQLFAFPFVSTGWSSCEGQILNIKQYQALFVLISNTY